MIEGLILWQLLSIRADGRRRDRWNEPPEQGVFDFFAMVVIALTILFWPVALGIRLKIHKRNVFLFIGYVAAAILFGVLLLPFYLLAGFVYLLVEASVCSFKEGVRQHERRVEEVIDQDGYVYLIDRRADAPLDLKEGQ